MGLKRREFLQRAGWGLAALGTSQVGLWQLGDRYRQVLAQPTRRKLALLVGINQYPALDPLQGMPLRGCVTDVELQRELLIHRFGFQPADILTLTDSQATRQNIETALTTHLSEQVKAGDVVVFHFSGYGSRVSLDGTSDAMQNSWVPADDWLPTAETPQVNDLLEDTLLQLLRSLPTENTVAILDTGYTNPPQLTDWQGSLRIRSRARPIVGQPKDDELAFLQELSTPRTQPASISILAAAAPAQFATEREWNGFSAGLFTYALTQTLWHATPTTDLLVSIKRATDAGEQLAGLDQQPRLSRGMGTLNHAALNTIFTPATPLADGFVAEVEDGGKTVQLWLAGLPATLVDHYGTNSLFTLAEEPSIRLQVRARSGLLAKAHIIETSHPDPEATDSSTPKSKLDLAGQHVQELIRTIPRNTELTVALDSHLERIERVDATSAFATIPHISAVAGEQPADYRFSRVPETTIAQTPSAPLPSLSQGRYGLFSLGQTVIPNSVGDGGEAVKIAVQRLTPQLKTLLAAKLLRLTENEGSSLLKVRATLATIVPESRVLMQREPARVAKSRPPAESRGSVNFSSVAPGTRIQYRLYNDSDQPVYFFVFCLDSAGRALVVNPLLYGGTETALSPTIRPGESVSVPTANTYGAEAPTEGWVIHGPAGVAETQVIFSQAPFEQTLATLDGGMQPVRDTHALQVLVNPVKVAQAVLQDLSNASLPAVQKAGVSTEDWSLEVSHWATFSFIYRVI